MSGFLTMSLDSGLITEEEEGHKVLCLAVISTQGFAFQHLLPTWIFPYTPPEKMRIRMCNSLIFNFYCMSLVISVHSCIVFSQGFFAEDR